MLQKNKTNMHLLEDSSSRFIFYHHMGTQYNAFAFYGKKLLGFDEVINSTLKELNEQGMGQIVEKKTKLEDGTELHD